MGGSALSTGNMSVTSSPVLAVSHKVKYCTRKRIARDPRVRPTILIKQFLHLIRPVLSQIWWHRAKECVIKYQIEFLLGGEQEEIVANKGCSLFQQRRLLYMRNVGSMVSRIQSEVSYVQAMPFWLQQNQCCPLPFSSIPPLARWPSSRCRAQWS